MPKNKQFHTPYASKQNTSVLETSVNRSLKRTSDVFESSINLSNFSHANDEDDDDNYIINQDLEALCKNKTKKIKMDN